MLDLSKYYQEEDDIVKTDVPTATTVIEEATPEPVMPEYQQYQFNQQEFEQSSKPLLEYLLQSQAKPEPRITPEQAKKAKFAGAMTDTFSLLAQMFTAGRGAHTRLDKSPGSMNVTNQRLEKLKDDYEKRLMLYDQRNDNIKTRLIDRQIQQGQAALDRQFQSNMRKFELEQNKIENDRRAKRDYDNAVNLAKEKNKQNIEYQKELSGVLNDRYTHNANEQIRVARNRPRSTSSGGGGGATSYSTNANRLNITYGGQTYNINKYDWAQMGQSMFGEMLNDPQTKAKLEEMGVDAYMNANEIATFMNTHRYLIPQHIWDRYVNSNNSQIIGGQQVPQATTNRDPLGLGIIQTQQNNQTKRQDPLGILK